MKKIILLLVGPLMVLYAAGQAWQPNSLDAHSQKYEITPLYSNEHPTDYSGIFQNPGNVASQSPDPFKRTVIICPCHKLDSITGMHWDKNKIQFIDFSKTTYEYNTQGNMILENSFSYDISNGWIKDTKEEYNYNDEGNVISITGYEWDLNISHWVPSYRHQYDYSDQKDNIIVITNHWDDVSGQWINNAKSTWYYDSQGNKTLSISCEWNGNDWINDEKGEISFDDNGNVLVSRGYYWDDLSNQWLPNEKDESMYDPNGLITSHVGYWWDNALASYTYSYYQTFTYDAEGNCTLEVRYDWNGSSAEWIGYEYYEYFYDTDGNRINAYRYTWNKTNKQWDLYSGIGSGYINSIKTNALIRPSNDEYYRPYYGHYDLSNYAIAQVSSVNYENDTWVFDDNYSYYYSDVIISNLQQASFADISVFPNPAEEYLTVKTDDSSGLYTMGIYNLVGEQIIKNSFVGLAKLNVSNLPKGIYLVVISDSRNTLKTEKIIVK
jgi:hypothetical protein